ncbi:hypothetical protein [Roseateles sp. LYH14W]|uniref:Uncharacterized protein n=1 Tax=Pelomonas parva TaxID=3299032 RepID=A0ABW7F5I0_9BURK
MRRWPASARCWWQAGRVEAGDVHRSRFAYGWFARRSYTGATGGH